MSFKVIFASATIIALTVVTGLLHGKLTLRWKAPKSSKLIALAAIPETIGPWRMTHEQDISDNAIYALRTDEWIYRTYSNAETGQRVNIAIVGGPHGPISVHLPEICYSSQKYQQVRERERVTVKDDEAGTSDAYWSLVLRANDVHASLLTVMYAWSVGNGWEAPDSARQHFAGSSRLLKLQISGALPNLDEVSDNACVDFLRDFSKSVGSLESSS